jgi:outer membrane receptor protein involved in Fe transport
MNSTANSPWRGAHCRPLVSFLLSSLLLPLAVAQTSTGSPPSLAPAKDDVLELNPFVVNTSKDVGYQANATLSGSRTSTALKDLANPVDVFTKELMDDLGIKDIQDLTLFAAGVAPNAVGDANTGGEEREVWNQNYMQIRGFKTGTATRNFMELQSVFDAYNSERVEFSKGPNSILFGTGNPGGSTNYSTKIPIFYRDFRSIQWGTDDEGTLRLTSDFNQVLVPGKLAARLNLLHQEREFYRKPGYDDENAGHLVVTYQPFKNTSITVGHEHRVVKRATPRGAFPGDSLTGYLDAGSPLVTAIPATGSSLQINGVPTNVSAASVGLRIFGTSYVYDSYGVARNTSRTATGANYAVNGSPNFTLDPEVIGFPRKYAVSGPNGLADVDWEITEANLTHQFGENLSVDLAFARSNSIKRIVNAVDNGLKFDPNAFGATNHAGQYYLDINPFWIDLDNEIFDYRGTAAYNLDLTRFNRWLGKHQIGVMAERNEREEVWDHGRLTLLSTPNGPNTNLIATSSRFYLREYLDPENGVFTAPDLRDFVYSNATISQNGYTAGFRRTTAFASKKDRTIQESFLGVLHSEWWDGRFVTTVGLRKDNRDFRTAAFVDAVERQPAALIPGAPVGSTDPAYALLPDVPTQKVSSISRNYGGVLHLTKWLGFSYSYTTNVSPGTESLGIFGQRVPYSSGRSKDYGLRFSFLDDKLSVSLLHYVTTEIGSIISGTTVNLPYSAMDGIEDILLEHGITTSNPLAAGSAWTTSDRQATGEELTVVGQITPAWTVRLAATRNVNQLGNIAPEARAFFAGREALYEQNSALLPLSGAGDSVGERLTEARTSFGLMETRENVQQFPASEYDARLTAKYTFGATRWQGLKGFSIGGNYRWSSAPIIGYYKNADSTFDVNRYVRGDEDRKIDLFFIYERKLSKNLSWKIQLNIDNVLDEKDPYAVGAINDMDGPGFKWVVYRMRPVDGRMVRLTNTISF